MSLARYVLWTALAAIFCTAAPSPLSERDITTDWPELLGPGNFPDMVHLQQVWDLINKGSGKYTTLTQGEATGFWNVLWALTKSHPDRNWIKSMFENSWGSEKDEGKVKVVLFESPSLKRSDQVVLTSNIINALPQDESGWRPPLWPLVIAEAAFAAGWRPDTTDNQVEELLERFTGRDATTIGSVEDQQKFFDAIGQADTVPTIMSVDTHASQFNLWFTVLTITDRDNGKFRVCAAPQSQDIDTAYGELTLTKPKRVVTLSDHQPFTGRPAGN